MTCPRDLSICGRRQGLHFAFGKAENVQRFVWISGLTIVWYTVRFKRLTLVARLRKYLLLKYFVILNLNYQNGLLFNI